MTATAPPPPQKKSFDPDDFRMSVGEHLEELRHRILVGLAGFVVCLVPCVLLAKYILSLICRPLVGALQAYNLNPQLFTNETTEAFMCWVQVCLIAAGALAGPWLIFQIWQFVASGLYPYERKAVTKYVPLSITLFLTGMVFVYYIVLPLTMRFFIAFSLSIPLDLPVSAAPPPANVAPAATQPSYIQATAVDPAHPQDYQWWFNTSQLRLKFYFNGAVRNIPFGSDSLMGAHFELSDYLSLVLRLLLTFGLCFQLPLVVMACERIGIVDVPQLKSWRRHVYFGMTILAAAVSPGDVVTATLALLAPLILLYEFGILMAKMGKAKRSRV
ncbi:MAG TPA: twin-arginine translocase subunit TatC [Tepidisphaeraceae bacterium]|nr:twin-arginine translocase subunit TatC [Tepidisphaeraceae bacterium]